MSEKEEVWKKYLKAREETTNFARQFWGSAPKGNECIKHSKRDFIFDKDGPIFDKLLEKEKKLLATWKKLQT